MKEEAIHFKANFPKFKRKDLRAMFSTMCPEVFDLFVKLLEYDPSKRISAKEALNHPYFKG